MHHWILAVAAIAPVAAASAAPAETPDLSGFWQHSPIAEYQPVPGSPAPVLDKKHPINTNNFQTMLEGDDTSPILQSWAAAEVRKRATRGARGGRYPRNRKNAALPASPAS